MKLEVTVLPVADIDRAKAFYQGLGWRLDADVSVAEHTRLVQLTPPDSPTSVQFGTGTTTRTPGSMMLIVEDIETARAELISHGADVSEIWHGPGLNNTERGASGPDPERHSYRSWASFADPEGNSWLHDWWDWYAAYLDARQRGSDPAAASAAAGHYMAEVRHVVAAPSEEES
jgi:catechol 2,3-dioxygenase-like lactoylglutathione lyase family enzyme